MADRASLRHRLFRWGTGFLAPALVFAVLAFGSRSTRATDPNGLPQVGAALSSDILAARLDSIHQTLVFVSDRCGLCRDRAGSYIHHLRRNDQEVLVVASSEIDPVFSPLAKEHPQLIDRIVFVPAGEFQSRTGVRTVPSYVRVNASLEITEVGMSNIGWFRSVMDPRHWLESWSQLIDG